ncbi:uncharacterized protein CELE_ZK945.7 [Caenorhabditis elegans]|uniref:Uncharacterized protein ZK945.7 n=1 Tax=Caenorhabditis elegans TaxID=6239 RepID=YS87_CAEEL|nr:Uncharacterized protein CELE_ZK945.7 [Caenorhabditis elegans]Q09383.1 RecName: Full=Uncharacterized protein ZK945.7 [Caenorhabditis elegans]CAA88440.1 Uncharacterized protein CELE_ZK945.7 [Caenorhabditis elegans]|eukprot:NP_496182.1 Uncharacterized protein CELE_ZK945.7 [Caenorhabditis elegans]
MASSFDNQMDQDGMCSVYSAQPSETNCSINEVLAKEIIAVNETPDDQADSSIYPIPKSETNVSASEGFQPCQDINQFNLSVYSAPKSETPVTMNEKFERCKDLMNVLDYSVYSMPPSEANVTMNVASFSEYTALASETNVTMADVLKNVAQDLASEHTAKSAHPTFDTTAYVERLQAELGIPDSKVIGLECSNFSNAKIIDSIECLHQLDKFQPIPVDFDQNPDFGKTAKSVESYLLRSSNASSIHHEI